MTGDEVSKLKESKVLYCRSSELKSFLEEFNTLLTDKIIVSGGTDEDFLVNDLQVRGIRRLYLQNSHFSDNRITFTLPIGIEDLSLAINGLPELLRARKDTKQKQILIGPFSRSHPVRDQIARDISPSKHVSTQQSLMSPTRYAKVAYRHLLIACPRGNGEDTHRFWESLYRGSLPIVQGSAWSESLLQMGIPVIEIDSWTNENLERVLERPDIKPIDPKSVPALWTNYWIQEIFR